jgi:predicted nucleotidyltransferase
MKTIKENATKNITSKKVEFSSTHWLKKLKTELVEVEPTVELILYGSRARGTAKEDSDWDLLILTENKKITNEIEKKYTQNLDDDLDEIPNEKAIQEIKNLASGKELPSNWAVSCDQKFFYYDDRNYSSDEKWYGSIFTQLSFIRKIKPNKIRGLRDSLPHLKNGGWHLSYFMSPENIKVKISTIADVEKISHFKNLSLEEIKCRINNSQDLYSREIKFSLVPTAIPKNLKEIIKKYLPHCIN